MEEKLSFEQCLKELEEVILKLENKEISLDDAIKNYQKGLELSKQAYDLFNQSQEMILKKVEGNKLTDFKIPE